MNVNNSISGDGESVFEILQELQILLLYCLCKYTLATGLLFCFLKNLICNPKTWNSYSFSYYLHIDCNEYGSGGSKSCLGIKPPEHLIASRGSLQWYKCIYMHMFNLEFEWPVSLEKKDTKLLLQTKILYCLWAITR